jgi:hypothetical protein
MNGIPLGIMASGHKFDDSVTYTVGSVNTNAEQGDIAAQTVTLPSNADNSDDNPIIVVGVKTNRDDTSAEDATFVNQSNFTRTDYKTGQSSNDAGRVGIFIGNDGRGVSNATTFTVDTTDEGFAQTLTSFFIKATGASTFSLRLLKAKNSVTFTIPADGADGSADSDTVVAGTTSAGDVILLVDYAFNNTSNDLPTKVIPSGFTEISDAPFDAGNEFRVVCSFKTMTADDQGTTFTGMNAESDTKWIYVFRGA